MELTRAAAVALALAALPVAVSADDGRWIYARYSPYAWVTVPCAVNYQCTVDLVAGDAPFDTYNGDATHWRVQYSEPELVLQNNTPGLRPTTVVMVSQTTKRRYKFILVPTGESRPTSVVIQLPTPTPEPRAVASAPYPHATPRPRPAAPPSLLAQADSACHSMRDGYHADPDRDRHGHVPKALTEIWPRLLCHDHDKTFIRLPKRDTADVDVPLVAEDTRDGLVEISHPHYDERTRMFVLMTTGDVVLQARDGGRPVNLHLRRNGA